MAVRSDIYIDWVSYPRIIYIEDPSNIIVLQDLVDTCRELEEELDNLDKPKLIDADGKQYLFTTAEGDNFVGITVTLQGAVIAFEARTGPSWILCSILGGNIVAVDTTKNPGDPDYYIDARYPTAFVTIDRTLSSSPTITEIVSGSGLSQEEHDQLMALPDSEEISDDVWDEELADHQLAGSFGHELATKADLAASASTHYNTAVNGIIIEGNEDSGTFASVQIRDNNYWQIGEVVGDGLTVELTFNIPDGHKPGQIGVFGRYIGVPSGTHFLDCIAYNYEAIAWETLVSNFMPGGMNSDAQYTHEYFERNIDRSNNNEVKIRLVHNITTYNASHAAYLDLVNVSSIEIITASDIADEVWQHGTAFELLGLMQKNYVMDQQVYQTYNNAKLLTSARVRIYEDAAKTQLIETYQITASWSNGECTSYEMVIV